ncbi:MAG: potassium transporter Trk [Synergistetes bacterium]|nr:potassium transporter Trk [Synergistota bacterium]
MLIFILAIVVGTLLLKGSWASKGISWIDSLFTATSAVCVTGLVVCDTGSDFTVWGQIIILILIQIGGLGIMSLSSVLAYALRGEGELRMKLITAYSLGRESPSGVKEIVKKVLIFTFIFELLGFLLLGTGLILKGVPVGKALYSALFHSISAFCNAGFSIYSWNLMEFNNFPYLFSVVMFLFIAGGLGFPVLTEIWERVFGGRKKLSAYSKVVIYSTLFLVLLGAVLLELFNIGNPGFEGFSPWEKFLMFLFHSSTPRTAGFNLVPLCFFSSPSLVLFCILMIIGASPGSTGGGIKTTTIAVLLASALKNLMGREETRVFNKRIPFTSVEKALTIALLYLVAAWIGSLIIYAFQGRNYFGIMFESISALSTVGLSLGITSHLKAGSKLVLVVLMLWGRVGIITFVWGLSKRKREPRISFPEEHIPVG